MVLQNSQFFVMLQSIGCVVSDVSKYCSAFYMFGSALIMTHIVMSQSN